MDSARLSPASYPLSKNNIAAWVVVAAITCLIHTIGLVAVKLAIRYKAAGWRPNDTALALGAAILIVQTICVILACDHGLGKHRYELEREDLLLFSKV